ncbi:hypothetical protein D5086_008650 [Populus alba]|uniref:Uncharacterized protein n=1 Tax=Populus alba TaxID=43335 RepID=A0ACC4CGI9_POPAL
MLKKSSSRSLQCRPGGLLTMICPLLLISLLTVVILSSDVSYLHFFDTNTLPHLFYDTSSNDISHSPVVLPYSLHSQISNLQTQLGALLGQLHNESSESKVAKFSDQVLRIAVSVDKLVNSLSSISGNAPASGDGMSRVEEDLSEAGEGEDPEAPGVKVFNTGELHEYTSPKLNRPSGKKNFLGLEAISPSIGLTCAHMATTIKRFMSYKLYGMCPDDWDLAQKLITSGCDPLPRRRCLSRASPNYNKPFPVNSSLWTQPNCFDLSKRRWEIPTNESVSAEFTIDQVLALKPREIRIGLDFSPTTGTFAALMKERNVTIASATLNLGAPFNEVIALRGLLPLYLSIGSRLPFFDNTLDIIHSTLFLDGWIGKELLQFVLFDWDRALRPKGLLWVDRFFCSKEVMKLYLDEFASLSYKKLLWKVVPKTDKDGDELFFSAVLEKPIRR